MLVKPLTKINATAIVGQLIQFCKQVDSFHARAHVLDIIRTNQGNTPAANTKNVDIC